MTSVSKCIQSGVCVVERWRGLEEESTPGPKPSHARLCAGQCAHKAPLSTPSQGDGARSHTHTDRKLGLGQGVT